MLYDVRQQIGTGQAGFMAGDAQKKSLWRRAVGRFAHARRRAKFLRSVNHLHGSPLTDADPDRVIVVALVRDGIYYMDEFLRHYRALGAAQFVFCDNGSTDGTLERAMAEPDTVVLQSSLRWGEIENLFRRHAAETYARGGWCLFADMDEIFDFEGAARIGLPGLVRYLGAQGYSALIAQMLEMFPDAPLADVAKMPYAEVLDTFCHYDLRAIRARGYHDPTLDFAWFLRDNTVADQAVQVLFGGVRKRVFDEDCCLTKHPLVRVDGQTVPGLHPHCAANVACADMTALIRHYKFANDPAARDRDTLARGAIAHGEDRKRLKRFDDVPGLSLWSEGAQRYDGPKALCDQGFLVRSAAYERYLEGQA